VYTAIGKCHTGCADCLLSIIRSLVLCTQQQVYVIQIMVTASVHHQESSAVYTATGICHTDYGDCLLSIIRSLVLCTQQ